MRSFEASSSSNATRDASASAESVRPCAVALQRALIFDATFKVLVLPLNVANRLGRILCGNLVKRPGRGTSATQNHLEPISKSSEEDNEAGELYKAEEVLSVVFPADEGWYVAIIVPGEEPLDGRRRV